MSKPHIADALNEIITRIKRELGAGGKLEGCAFNRRPTTDSEGEDQLPNIRFTGYSDEEENFAGAKAMTNLSNSVVRSTQNLTFSLAFRAENGPFSQDGKTQLGLLDWISRFKDSIELDSNSCQDLTLNSSCVEPMLTSVSSTEVNEISWIIEFQVMIYPIPYIRGTRSLPK
jgi:hypothetical protein